MLEMISHSVSISGFGSNPFHAGGLLFAEREIRTASGLGLEELAKAGYDLRQLARYSKTVKQAVSYASLLRNHLSDMRHRGDVMVT